MIQSRVISSVYYFGRNTTSYLYYYLIVYNNYTMDAPHTSVARNDKSTVAVMIFFFFLEVKRTTTTKKKNNRYRHSNIITTTMDVCVVSSPTGNCWQPHIWWTGDRIPRVSAAAVGRDPRPEVSVNQVSITPSYCHCTCAHTEHRAYNNIVITTRRWTRFVYNNNMHDIITMRCQCVLLHQR